MAPVIVVFCVWFGVVAVLAAVMIATGSRWRVPRWGQRLRHRFVTAADDVIPTIGRGVTASVVLLALWSVVIIVGLVMGIIAHRLQGPIDEPAFHWWFRNHLQGAWHDIWWKLTNIGMPRLTQGIAAVAAVAFSILYRRRPFWWAPAVTMIAGYAAEKYSQMILKAVIKRGHPPTAGGSYPSGGMGRLIDVYGLVIFFVIWYFWPRLGRAWAVGASLLLVLLSIQAYARINNLEHWTTDVVGGAVFGLMLLAMMIIGYFAMTRPSRASTEVAPTAASDEPRLARNARS